MENLNTKEINGLEQGQAQPAETTTRAPYWQEEQPLVLIAGNLSLTLFEKTGVVQIGFLVEDENGRRRIGRRISLKKEKLQNTPRALFLMRDIFKKWADEITGKRQYLQQ